MNSGDVTSITAYAQPTSSTAILLQSSVFLQLITITQKIQQRDDCRTSCNLFTELELLLKFVHYSYSYLAE